MAFYCNGKKGICDYDILCADCDYFDNSGGKATLTKADRIRAMSDEELAQWICSLSPFCFQSECPGYILCNGTEAKANGMKKWLQQPAEE